MLPTDPLITEHKLINRMAAVIARHLTQINARGELDVEFIDSAVDFARTYADRVHHGKEEDILFRALAAKPISALLRQAMNDLVEEHEYGRKKTTLLVAAKELYVEGSRQALKKVTDILRELADFYPNHAAKEEEHFFNQAMEHFTAEEKDTMLREMWDFDRQVIHEKYTKLVGGLEESCR